MTSLAIMFYFGIERVTAVIVATLARAVGAGRQVKGTGSSRACTGGQRADMRARARQSPQ